MKFKSLAAKELERRRIKSVPVFTDGTYKLQDDFIDHPSKFKAFLATRRCGKSYTCGKYLVKTAYENPG